MRAGDRDQEAVTEVLREACGEGRLSVPELEERLELAYAARTLGQLDALVADLPHGLSSQPAGSHLVPTDAPLTIAAGMSNETRTGRWVVPQSLIVRAHLGNVKLDFTTALISHHRLNVDIRADAGTVVLVVPHGWRVDTDMVRRGVGSVKNRVDQPLHGDVEVIVTGLTAMGNLVAPHPRPVRWRWLTGV